MRIAILERHAGVRALLHATLTAYDCRNVAGSAELLQHPAELLIADSAAAAHSARAAGMPVLLSSPGDAPLALLAVLNTGICDYMVRPLRRKEVLLRVQLLLQRAYPQQRIRFAQYQFEPLSKRILRDEHIIDVTHKEFDLALLLFENLGRPLSRAYIQDMIWPRHSELPTELPSRTMDTHISRVRNKLQLTPQHGFQLTPVYGYGYQLASC